MTYDFTVYRKDGRERLDFTVEAAGEDLARMELERRLVGLGITAAELVDWKIGAMLVRKGGADA